jgi:hypothetical protein
MRGSFHCVIAGGAMGFIIFLLTRLIILYRAVTLGVLPDGGQQLVQDCQSLHRDPRPPQFVSLTDRLCHPFRHIGCVAAGKFTDEHIALMLFNSSQDGKSFSRERMPSVVNSYRFIRIMLYTCKGCDYTRIITPDSDRTEPNIGFPCTAGPIYAVSIHSAADSMTEISHECHGAWKAAILLGLCGVRGAAGSAVSGIVRASERCKRFALVL